MNELDIQAHEGEPTKVDTQLNSETILEAGSQLGVRMTAEQAEQLAQHFNTQEAETGEPATNSLLEHLQQSV